MPGLSQSYTVLTMLPQTHKSYAAEWSSRMPRRQMLETSASVLGGLSLASFLQLRTKSASAASPTRSFGRAKSCILIYCWGGMSHLDSWDLKPEAPAEIRGPFELIDSATPGIQISEHLPHLAQQTGKLAIVRSICHDDSAHGRGMYWNLTGHRPPRAGNIPPMSNDWPSFAAVVSKLRSAPSGVPAAVRIPYPMVDNDTLQAGEYGGWLGVRYDPVVLRTPAGQPFGGVSRSLGSEVLELNSVDGNRLASRGTLRREFERPVGHAADFQGFEHFHALANEILSGSAVRQAYDLEREDTKVRESYGKHLGGQSMLLARRLVEAGVPIVQVCCAAGDLNGGSGDMWDTHSDNFNRLKDRLLPTFDRGMSALLDDLAARGTLDQTLVVMLTDFGRTPRINRGAGRDHYPSVYSILMAGGGIQGGQVYGSSDGQGAFAKTQSCGPPDVHATMFHLMGIHPRTELRDPLNRPLPVSDGQVLPLV